MCVAGSLILAEEDIGLMEKEGHTRPFDGDAVLGEVSFLEMAKDCIVWLHASGLEIGHQLAQEFSAAAGSRGADRAVGFVIRCMAPWLSVRSGGDG